MDDVTRITDDTIGTGMTLKLGVSSDFLKHLLILSDANATNSLVLLHNCGSADNGLPSIRTGLRAKGYRITSISARVRYTCFVPPMLSYGCFRAV